MLASKVLVVKWVKADWGILLFAGGGVVSFGMNWYENIGQVNCS